MESLPNIEKQEPKRSEARRHGDDLEASDRVKRESKWEVAAAVVESRAHASAHVLRAYCVTVA